MSEQRSGFSWVGLGIGALVLLFVCGGGLVVAFSAGGYFWMRGQEGMPTEMGVHKRLDEQQEVETQHQNEAKAQLLAAHAAAVEQARAQYDAGAHEEALTTLDKLLLEDPENVEGWVLHGRALVKMKDRDRAMQDFTRALTIDEKRQDAYDYRAFLYYQAEMYPEAMGDIARLLTLDPNNGRAYKLRSDCNFQMGNIEKAKEDAKKSCDLGYEEGCTATKRLKAR